MRLLLACMILLGACGHPEAPVIHGAGASFPFPIYFKWFGEYQRLHPQARINYQSIGSGGGLRQLAAGTVSFAGTDIPAANAQNWLHVPAVIGGVAVAYHLPSLSQPLRLRPETLAAIYLGEISTWNDPQLLADNPALAAHSQPITVIRRSDGSGTTYAFTEYLAKVCPDWRHHVGAGPSVKWPTGLGAKGSEGVTGLLEQTPFSIGYLEYNYARQNHLPVAAIRNAAGHFITPSLESFTSAAATNALAMSADFRASLTNSTGPADYPITSFTWLVTPRDHPHPSQTIVLKGFLLWMLTEGQRMAAALNYAPLPPAIAQRAQEAVSRWL